MDGLRSVDASVPGVGVSGEEVERRDLASSAEEFVSVY